jgi:hypothetical protein
MSRIQIVTEFIQAWNDNDLDHATGFVLRGLSALQLTLQKAAAA